jgi:hypothetical protein
MGHSLLAWGLVARTGDIQMPRLTVRVAGMRSVRRPGRLATGYTERLLLRACVFPAGVTGFLALAARWTANPAMIRKGREGGGQNLLAHEKWMNTRDKNGDRKIRLATRAVFSAFCMAESHRTKAAPISKTPT